MAKKAKSRIDIALAKVAEKRRGLKPVYGFVPYPCELDIGFMDVETATSYRFSACPNYSACLDVACAGRWIGFSCRACDVFQSYSDQKWTKRLRRIR
jgi:hypothetical protein